MQEDIRQEVIRLANRHFRNYKETKTEIITECPFCKGGEKRQKKTFSINKETGQFICNRQNNCGKTGNLRMLVSHLEGGSIYKPYVKQYSKPTTKSKPPVDWIVEYFNSRGISKDTLYKYRVGTDDKGMIVFSYKDENDELIFVKHRTKDKQFFADAGCKQIFFGMNLCKGFDSLVITEGEIDMLTLAECGIENPVSLPIGAGKLDCVDNCYEWLSRFKTVYLWGDNDDVGRKSVDALLKRIGEGKCRIVDVPEKDANETFTKRGKDAVIEAIECASYVECDDVIRASQIRAIAVEDKRRARYGLAQLDKYMGGYRMGELTVWTGINSSGKSTLINQAALKAIEDGFKVCIYSGEFQPERVMDWINLQAAGVDYINVNEDAYTGSRFYSVKPDAIEDIREWYDNHLYLYVPPKKAIVGDVIFDRFKYIAQRFGVEVFIIDNLIKCTIGYSDKDMNMKQTEFVSNAHDFAHENDVHVHLIAHPRKPSAEARLAKSDIAGSFNITNLADNVLAVHRMSDKEKNNEKFLEAAAGLGIKSADSIVEIFKNRYGGIQDVGVFLLFNPICKRFYMANENFNYAPPWVRKEEEQVVFNPDECGSVYSVEF